MAKTRNKVWEKDKEIRDRMTLRLPRKMNLDLKGGAKELGISQNEYILLLLNEKLSN